MFRLCTFDFAALGQTLVTQHPEGFDFRTLTATAAVFQHLEVARASHAVFVVGAIFLDIRNRAPQYQQFADVLNRCGAEFICQGLKHGFAGDAVIPQNADFDQTVGIEGGVDFFGYSGG